MKKLHYAWIEQIHSFDTAEERDEYIREQTALAERKQQAPIQVKEQWFDLNEKRYFLRIRKPYNNNPMLNT